MKSSSLSRRRLTQVLLGMFGLRSLGALEAPAASAGDPLPPLAPLSPQARGGLVSPMLGCEFTAQTAEGKMPNFETFALNLDERYCDLTVFASAFAMQPSFRWLRLRGWHCALRDEVLRIEFTGCQPRVLRVEPAKGAREITVHFGGPAPANWQPPPMHPGNEVLIATVRVAFESVTILTAPEIPSGTGK